MAEVTQLFYSHQELVTIMLKDRDIHAGHWMMVVNFGFAAMNAGQEEGGTDVSPTAMVGVNKIGIQQIPESTPFSIDAAVANPPQS
jgi:hypothetical protein